MPNLKSIILHYFKKGISENEILQLVEDTGKTVRLDYIYQVISDYKKVNKGVLTNAKTKSERIGEDVVRFLLMGVKPSVIAKSLRLSRQYIYN